MDARKALLPQPSAQPAQQQQRTLWSWLSPCAHDDFQHLDYPAAFPDPRDSFTCVCVCVPLQPHAHEGPRLAQGSTCALLKFLIIVKHLYSHFYFAPDPANELTTSPWRSGLLPPLISENEAGLERFRNSLGAHS